MSNPPANDHPSPPSPPADISGLAWRLTYAEELAPKDRRRYFARVRKNAERLAHLAELSMGGAAVIADPAMREAIRLHASRALAELDFVEWMLGAGL